MKTKYLLAAGAILLIFVLAGCTIEYDTKVQPDQSGTVSTAIGFTADELKALNSQSTSTGGSVCDDMWNNSKSKLPSNAVTREEQKGTETWCYADIKFATLDELKSFYGDQNTTINRLEVVNNTFYYDVSIDMSNDEMTSASSYPLTFTWTLTMPGAIKSNNADKVSGQTLSWDLTSKTGVVDMQAESSLSSSTAWVWWVVGTLVCLCLIVIVIVVIVIVIVSLRKKKETPAAATPEPPAPAVPAVATSEPVTPVLPRPARKRKDSSS